MKNKIITNNPKIIIGQPLNPDIVLITGDMIDGSAPIHPHMLNAIDDLEVPVFLVTGNHEVYESLEMS